MLDVYPVLLAVFGTPFGGFGQSAARPRITQRRALLTTPAITLGEDFGTVAVGASVSSTTVSFFVENLRGRVTEAGMGIRSRQGGRTAT